MQKLLLVFLIFFNVACYQVKTKPSEAEFKNTGIAGFVFDEKNNPVPDAFVYIYRSASSGLMGPADFMEKTDERGFFYFDIPEGKYYLVVRKRQSGLDSGPLRQGDRASVYQKNPVIVKPGELSNVKIILPTKTQIFQKKTPRGDVEITIKLLNKPEKNLYALFYNTGHKPHSSPEFIKEIYEDSFKISLPSNKTYYIIVRETLKDKIENEEIYGHFGPFLPEKINDMIIIKLDKYK